MDYRPPAGPGGLVSPSGGFVSLVCDQGLHFASIKLCQASWIPVIRCHYLVYLAAQLHIHY